MHNSSESSPNFPQVLIHRGGARDPATDPVIGKATVDLTPLLQGDKVEGTYGITSEHEGEGEDVPAGDYEGTLDLEVTADQALADRRRGGRFLRLSSARFSPVPPSWWLPEDEERPRVVDAAAEAELPASAHEERANLCNGAWI